MLMDNKNSSQLTENHRQTGLSIECVMKKYKMTTQKQFQDGKPVPVTPKTNEDKVKDATPGQNISGEDKDYDENEHSADLAAFEKETGLDGDVKSGQVNK